MPLVYVVACNFNCPDRERAWNEWYNGPKLAEMLAKPLFVSCQRFKAAALDTEVSYLAVWEVESAAAFETTEYRSSWGFAEWADCIVDWTRDLYRLEDDRAAGALACPAGAMLQLVRIDDQEAGPAREAREAIAHDAPDLAWGNPVGLDHSTSSVGFRVLAEDVQVPAAASAGAAVRETCFRPLIDYTIAPSAGSA
jgi:hypothetical protein